MPVYRMLELCWTAPCWERMFVTIRMFLAIRLGGRAFAMELWEPIGQYTQQHKLCDQTYDRNDYYDGAQPVEARQTCQYGDGEIGGASQSSRTLLATLAA